MNEFFRKLLIAILAIGQVAFSLSAQNEQRQIDSLQKILNVEKSDTSKLALLSEIMNLTSDLDFYFKYNEQAIKICEKNINATGGKEKDFYLLKYAEGLINRGYLYQNKGENVETVKSYEKAKVILGKIKEKTEDSKSAEAYLYNNISAVYRDLGKGKEALKFQEEAIKLFEELNDKVGLASAYNNLGSYYSSVAQMSLALIYLNKGLEVYKELNDKEGLATSYNNIGDLQGKLGNEKEVIANYLKAYDLIKQTNDKRGEGLILQNIGISYGEAGNVKIGLDYLHRSLTIMEELKEKKGICFVLMNIGGIYFRDGDYKASEEYTLKGLEIAKEINFVAGIATCYLRLGNAFGQKKQYKKAYDYFRLAYTMSLEDDQSRTLVDILNSMGAFQYKQGAADSALYYYNRSLKIADKVQYKQGKATAIVAMSEIYFSKNNLPEARKLGEQALGYMKEFGHILEQKNASNLLYKIYKKTGEDTKALEMHELYMKMNDSLKTEETQRAIIKSQLTNEYNELKAKDSLAYLGKEKANSKVISQKEEQLKKSEVFKYILMLISIVLVVVAFLLYKNYNKKKQHSMFVEKENTILEAKNKERELLMHEIHHRVKNNLQIVSSLLKMPQKNIQDMEALEVMDDSRQRIHSISLIHKLLYEKSDLTHINAKEYVDELCNAVLKSFTLPDQKVDLKLDINELKMEVDQFLPLALILNELLLNSIKYAFDRVEDPQINIHLEKKEDQIIFNFSDNGKEDASDLIKAKNSFGTKMIFSLTEQLNGLINVYFKNGTNISIKFDAA